eukprot:NODE_269_length_11261_cov_0.600359.p5 type:complete len:309 gc:universal NODE_269_length_11261_cov_0.600359:9075-8149(-)
MDQLLAMFPNIPLSIIQKTVNDCGSIQQAIEILVNFKNPISELKLLFPDHSEYELTTLYNKYQSIERVANILIFGMPVSSQPEMPIRNDWQNKTTLSEKLQRKHSDPPKPPNNTPTAIIKPILPSNIILLPLDQICSTFFDDKFIPNKPIQSYATDIQSLHSKKLQLSHKSVQAYSSRRNHKYNGQGGAVASNYSINKQDIEMQIQELKLQQAYAILHSQSTAFHYDFHNIQVKEAKIILLDLLDFHKSHRAIINGNSASPSITIVTGKGNNSYQGYSKLKIALLSVLEKEGLNCEDNCTGYFKFKLK